MSVIIKAKNVVFNNPNLPILTPMVSGGLIGSFRPSNTALGLTDLSGNGHQLLIQGSPQFTDKSVIVDKDNGLISDIQETLDMTLIVVYRAIKNTQASGENQWLGMVVGTYYNDRGMSIFTAASNNKNQVDVLGQAYTKKTSDGSVSSKITWNGSFDNASGIAQTEYQFNALVVNASGNKLLTYTPARQLSPITFYDGFSDVSLLSTRSLIDPTTKSPNLFKFGIANVPFGSGKAEIAEVLIYNRPLSQEEITRQYRYSKEFLLKHRGIII